LHSNLREGEQLLFLRVTLGASCLQEILADRYAASVYGVRDFVDGLTQDGPTDIGVR
jgi:hypothetical protein